LTRFSRRSFVLTATGALVSAGAPVLTSQQNITAQQLVDRIREKLGVPWREKTVDGFKAGDPGTVVTGVMAAGEATRTALGKAANVGQNLVISLGPVFYTANDDPGNRATDPVYVAKKAYIEQRRLVIWRFSDHWHARQPNANAVALAEALGWSGLKAQGGDDIYNIPETTFSALVAHVRSRLSGIDNGTRTIGHADMRVRTVLLSTGVTDLLSTVAKLPRADVLIAGEPREWEVVPYVLDSRTAGQQKGMIALGRLVSEHPGVRACAGWIKSFTPEVPVEPFGTSGPYWIPS